MIIFTNWHFFFHSYSTCSFIFIYRLAETSSFKKQQSQQEYKKGQDLPSSTAQSFLLPKNQLQCTSEIHIHKSQLQRLPTITKNEHTADLGIFDINQLKSHNADEARGKNSEISHPIGHSR